MGRILIITYGSRGDVEPYVALGLGLKASGHQVALATAGRFAGWVRSFGLDFHTIDDASLDQIDTPAGKTMIEGNRGLMARGWAAFRLSRGAGAMNSAMMDDALTAAEAVRPDAIIYHPKGMAGAHIAEAWGIPAFMVTLQPLIIPTADFAASLNVAPLPALNLLSYRLVGLSYAMFRRTVARFRVRLGLPPLGSTAEILRPRGAGLIPVIHPISPSVLPRPADWPPEALLTGYWRLPDDEAFTPSPELEAFLNAGPPPVFVGFGSMPSSDPAALARLVAQALAQAGRRGVVARGWAGLEVAASDDLIAVPPLPYRWLFPRMAAIVHHGGAGTTAEALHSGAPQAIVPFFGDQPFWGARTAALGVGAAPIPRRRLTAETLAAAIASADQPQMHRRASALASRLDLEDGVAEAVRYINGRLGRPNAERSRSLQAAGR
ncbi:glycosyltransferase [Pseudoroseicyclus tamaricis]|uniref:Glycosyltransferase family 1 protein n=1 Tax=Pseudoroseicyclus tamaricis TaxID=2705421 RepID=A0A6B2JPR0_9RHOB|nr:glycosyltransferase [Pseudoroseicyclus tamaricis]NDU99944.1 glycosyltransferase family 1 protein [Pseudoroseicyclus tamaricis]